MFARTCVHILLVLILFIGGVGSASAEAEAPVLSAGMEWKYSASLSLASLIGQVEGGFEELLIQGTVVMRVDSLQTVDVLGSTYETWVIALDGDFDVEFTYDVPDVGPLVMSAPAKCEGLLYLDNESYEYVKSSITITSSFTRFSVRFGLVVEIDTSIDIETDTWLFPFDTGSVGVTTGRGSSYAHYVARVNDEVVGENETTATFITVSTYECVGQGIVSVEAGDFQAYELDVSSAGIYLFGYPQGYRREYYSNEVNNSVEIKVYDEEHQLIGEWMLLSYGESVGTSGDWVFGLAILIGLVMILMIFGIIMLRRKSRDESLERSLSATSRVCRRCGVHIPEGESVCGSCGRASR